MQVKNKSDITLIRTFIGDSKILSHIYCTIVFCDAKTKSPAEKYESARHLGLNPQARRKKNRIKSNLENLPQIRSSLMKRKMLGPFLAYYEIYS